MQRRDEIRDLFVFNQWANARTLGAVAVLNEDEFHRDLKSSYPSVRETLLHIMASEWIWLTRWQGTSPTGMPPAWAEYTRGSDRGRVGAPAIRAVHVHRQSCGRRPRPPDPLPQLAGRKLHAAALAADAAYGQSFDVPSRAGHDHVAPARPHRRSDRPGALLSAAAAIDAEVIVAQDKVATVSPARRHRPRSRQHFSGRVHRTLREGARR